MNQNSIKRFLVPGIIIAFVVLVVFWVIGYFTSFKDISFEVVNPNNDQYSLKVYESIGHDLSISQYDSETPKHTFSSNQTVSLRTGEYVSIITGEGIEPQISEFGVTDDTTNTYVLRYSEAKLKSILREQHSEIRNAVYKYFPTLKPNANIWKFIDEKLHEQGQWYTATFRERKDPHADIYRLVVEKNNDTWQVVTDPPDLVITANRYPTVPRNVLVDLNRRQVVQPRER